MESRSVWLPKFSGVAASEDVLARLAESRVVGTRLGTGSPDLSHSEIAS
jgi:hypothetical protein